jgi:hypothetical protein
MQSFDVSHLLQSPNDAPDDILASLLFLRSRVPKSIPKLIPVIQVHGILSSDTSKIDRRVEELIGCKNGLRRFKMPGDDCLMLDHDYIHLVDSVKATLQITEYDSVIFESFKRVLAQQRSLDMSRDALLALLQSQPSSPSSPSSQSNQFIPDNQVDAVTQLIRWGLLTLPKQGKKVSLAVPKSGAYYAALSHGRKELLKLLKSKSGATKDSIATKFNKILFANRSPAKPTSSTTPDSALKRQKVVVLERGSALDLETHLAELRGKGWIETTVTPMGEIIRLTSKGISHAKNRMK